MAEQLEIGKLIYDLEEEALLAMKEVAEKRDMDESKRGRRTSTTRSPGCNRG